MYICTGSTFHPDHKDFDVPQIQITTSTLGQTMIRRATIPYAATRCKRLLTNTPIRLSSSSLLGHSPMAQPTIDPANNAARIPTVRDAEISGVWQATSAKRDKLGELKGEAAGVSLDDMATEAQKLDLYLVDGLEMIAKHSENHRADDATTTEWVDACASGFDDSLHETAYTDFLSKLDQEIQQRLSKYPPDRCLQQVQDFFDTHNLPEEDYGKWEKQLTKGTNDLEQNFTDAVTRLRLQHASACVEDLITLWKTWTTLTDQDVDRLAVQQKPALASTTVSKGKVVAVIKSHLEGNGGDRLDAMWRLMDHDNDELLDQDGMEKVCKSLVLTTQKLIPELFQDGLRSRGPPTGSWLQRRRQTRHQKHLGKILQKTTQKHFDIELEFNHRLRCIYSWANKKHQDNKIDSVVVEEEGGIVTGVMGRKRYVELHPKISVQEFREVQSVHFPQIDRVTSEYLHGFREDLLVQQGKGRQRRELLREGSLFFFVVCVADYIILSF